MAALLILIGLLSASACSRGTSATPPAAASPEASADIALANESTPGERIDLSAIAVAGKTTIFEFFSDDCEPSRKMVPILEDLGLKRPDLAIRRLDVDRPNADGIDFGSPLMEQYGMEKVPYFIIWDDKGKEMASGEEAKRLVRGWYSAATQ